MKAPEALLFDLGGVVIDISFERCFAAWASSSGKGIESIRKAYAFDEMYAKHECSRITGEEYYRHVNASLGLEISFDDFEGGWNAIYVGVIPETLQLLREIQRQVKLFAFANSNSLHYGGTAEGYARANAASWMQKLSFLRRWEQ